MSSDQPPPQAGRNPFGPQPAGASGSPHLAPSRVGFGGPAAPAPFAPQPAAPERDHLGRGLAVGVLMAIAGAIAYGVLLRALAHDNGSTTELGYGPLAVGALVGICVGKVGGRNLVLPVAACVLTVLAVVLGGLFGTALIETHLVSRLGGDLSLTDIVFHHFGALWKAWKHDFDVPRFLALCFAALAAYGLATRFGDR
ncbi:hypothetical protein [Streptomyces sp. NPDC049040]|uniref:hypothetical protein n=1 Tax=Streptomyces sp. NPDC049040 TaxID=3365593 RepID=UPI003715ED07